MVGTSLNAFPPVLYLCFRCYSHLGNTSPTSESSHPTHILKPSLRATSSMKLSFLFPTQKQPLLLWS